MESEAHPVAKNAKLIEQQNSSGSSREVGEDAVVTAAQARFIGLLGMKGAAQLEIVRRKQTFQLTTQETKCDVFNPSGV